MKLSARNQLKGKVISIEKGAVNGIVGIELKGGDVITATISLSAIQELDLAVVKAVCPQFIPLGVGWRDRYIGGDRILDVPQKIGLSDHQLAYSELTPYPHPFP